MSYKDRLRSTKAPEEETSSNTNVQCCDNQCIEPRDGDSVCVNCGMIYDINPTSMDFRSELKIKATATCPGCKSNTKDVINKAEWKKMS